ncbi:hypothetical protein MUG91_G18n9 [Manis pentadactyla]|nr:hypothetical protein MUG91_G18n9 [Manis pentadactyla]
MKHGILGGAATLIEKSRSLYLKRRLGASADCCQPDHILIWICQHREKERIKKYREAEKQGDEKDLAHHLLEGFINHSYATN